MKKCKNTLGFTLIELLVVLSIAAILLSVAVPSFTSLISANNADNATAKLANIFAYARSEAVVRVANVTVCASVNGTVCDTTATDDDWAAWWRVEAADGTLLKVENITGLAVTFAVTDDSDDVNTVADESVDLNALTQVCFDQFGVECIGNFPYIVFTVTSNGETSSKRLYSSGAVSL
jgi:prepilin-type N-terminal cleavage/methylation domain-containing protein